MSILKNMLKGWRTCYHTGEAGDDMRPGMAAGSHIGRVRKMNEDNYALIRFPGVNDAILAVADGVGGAAAGEVASCFAIKYLLRERFRYGGDAINTPEAMRKLLVDGLHRANAALSRINLQLGSESFSMGTTVTAAGFVPGAVIIVHAGDSRCYRLREGRVEQLTKDHTWAQNLVLVGELEQDEVAGHHWEHTLSNCLGILSEIDLEVDTFELQGGDRLLLCTDGVTSMLSQDEIAGYLVKTRNPGKLVKELIGASLHKGGADNIAIAAAYMS